MKMAVYSFLKEVVEVCKIKTDMSHVIKVSLLISDESDIQGKINSISMHLYSFLVRKKAAFFSWIGPYTRK